MGMKRKVLIGNFAVAEAVKLARVQVVAAYPITPQTLIVERIAEMVERGELRARYIRVESEHSALAAVFGAALGGARAFTATSSHGLLYMYEVVWWAGYCKAPLVMALVTRTIGPPWNIHSDHHDILSVRDSGWIIGMAENVQEIFDMTLQAFKIAEDKRVLQPVMVGLDAFTLSHTAEPLNIPEQSDVDAWLPPREPLPFVMSPENPFSVGNIGPNEYTMELRWAVWRSLERAKQVIKEVDRDYAKKLGGREYGGLVERYRTEDAKYIAITWGAWSGDAKEAIDALRDEGIPIGLARIRFARPFPREDLEEIASGARAIVVVDRAVSMGMDGVFSMEVRNVVGKKVPVKSVVAGIGGVDTSYKDFCNIFRKFVEEYEKGLVDEWHIPEWYMPWR